MYISAKTILAAIAVIAYALLIWFLPPWLHLAGGKAWLLRVVILGVGLVAFGVVLWWLRSRKKATETADQSPTGGPVSDEISYLIRAAQDKLRSSRVRGARIGTLPVVFLIGEGGSGKTCVATNCGLDPEHLAGQVFQDGAVAPTSSLNLWFARRVVLVEAAGRLLDDPAGWAYTVRRLAPAKLRSIFAGARQAPRAAVVCFDCEPFVRPVSIDSITSAAKVLQCRLREASAILGASLPVYVLFTKADAIPFFAEYVGTLSKPEAGQVLGVTLPVQDYHTGLYAQDQTDRLTKAFDQLFYSLGHHRTEYLAREQDPARLPGIYEFPREFRKIKGALVQMLVELCRPSQLSAGPFLRGFYFTGVRMVLEEAGPVAARTSPASAPASAEPPPGVTQIFNAGALQQAGCAQSPTEEVPPGATRVFDLRSITGGEGSAAVGTVAEASHARWVPQWSFLSHIFGDLILQDHTALGTSSSSTKVGFWRRFLLATAVAFFLVCCIGFTVSYFENQSLVSQLKVAQAVSFTTLQGNQVPSVSDLHRLDEVGQLLDTLSEYRVNRPWRYRWGLYMGVKIYPMACQAYARGLAQLLLGPAQTSMVASLKSLSNPSPSATLSRNESEKGLPPYDVPYKTLKTYLITTIQGNHAGEDPSLSSDLYANWPSGQMAGRDQERLVRAQFERYYAQLASGDAVTCFSSSADNRAVGNAQSYLNSFPAQQHVYEAMLAGAAKGAKDINFNKDYRGSDQIVINAVTVPAAFTKDGWKKMQDALKHPERYTSGEKWVLGDSSKQAVDPQALMSKLQAQYHDDFIGHWKEFLRVSRFAGYKNPADISNKLEKVASARSWLLMTFCVVLKNTSFDPAEKDIQDIFSPAGSLETDHCDEKPAGALSKAYSDALLELDDCPGRIDRAAPEQKEDKKKECQGKADDAERAVRKMDSPNTGPDQDVNKAVENLLLAPIVQLEPGFRPTPPPGPKSLCDRLRTFNTKFPSEVTLEDFQAIFGPEGLLGKFKPPTEKANLHYVRFYNDASTIQKALYPDGRTLHMCYTITAQASLGVSSFNLAIGGQSLNAFGSPKEFVWTGSAQETVTLVANNNSPVSATGSLAIFGFFPDNADPPGQLSGPKYTVQIPVGTGRPNRQTPRLKLVIEAGAATALFENGWAGKLGCTTNMTQ